jgi:hypothetical protein
MEASRVPAALRARLGDEGTIGLLEFMDSTRREWSEYVLSLATDRFERRLTEELSALRIEIAQSQANLKQELKQELHEGLTAVRQEISELRQETANFRVEIIRWCFGFWIGQVAVVGGMLAFFLRATGR